MRRVVKVVLAAALGAACAGPVAMIRNPLPKAPSPAEGDAARAVIRSPFDSSWEVGEPEYYTAIPQPIP